MRIKQVKPLKFLTIYLAIQQLNPGGISYDTNGGGLFEDRLSLAGATGVKRIDVPARGGLVDFPGD